MSSPHARDGTFLENLRDLHHESSRSTSRLPARAPSDTTFSLQISPGSDSHSTEMMNSLEEGVSAPQSLK